MTPAAPLRSIAISSRGRHRGHRAGSGAAVADVGASEAPPSEQIAPDCLFQGIEAPRGEADDLKRLPNVDDKLEQRLNDLGVYASLADRRPRSEMAEALYRGAQAQGGVAAEGWVAAAKKLVEAAAV